MEQSRGWQFPPRFEKESGTVCMTDGFNDIAESLSILLSTQPGEHWLDKHYGCDLRQYLFETRDDGILGEIQTQVSSAIARFEPRVKVDRIDASVGDKGAVVIAIDVTPVSDPEIRRRLTLHYDLESGRWEA